MSSPDRLRQLAMQQRQIAEMNKSAERTSRLALARYLERQAYAMEHLTWPLRSREADLPRPKGSC